MAVRDWRTLISTDEKSRALTVAYVVSASCISRFELSLISADRVATWPSILTDEKPKIVRLRLEVTRSSSAWL